MDNMSDDKDVVRWYVMRAYKADKRIEEALAADGSYEYFIPKQEVIRIVGGKRKKVVEPAIPGLLFIHTSRTLLRPFKDKNAVLQYAMWQKTTGMEFITVPEKQMSDFIAVATAPETAITFHSLDSVNRQKGGKVIISGGPFAGVEGMLVKVKGRRNKQFVIQINGVGIVVVRGVEEIKLESNY